MPGNVLWVRCPCGFEDEVWPGSDGLIAYVGQGFAKLSGSTASALNLKTLPDPFLEDPSWIALPREERAQKFADHLAGMWDEKGPYDCPRCKRATLTVRFGGWWD